MSATTSTPTERADREARIHFPASDDPFGLTEATRFVSDVAHELRGPLTTLVATVEVISRRTDDLPDRVVAAVELLDAQVHSLNRLVVDILDISFYDAGLAALDVQPIRLERFLGELLDRRGEGATLQIADDADLVRADPRRLCQIMTNLLDNARNYAGGATSLRSERGPGAIRLVVEDAGPGLTEEERGRVFARFERGTLGRKGSVRGSGLGLALVAEHVRLHDGRVWIEDAAPTGARFVVALPHEP